LSVNPNKHKTNFNLKESAQHKINDISTYKQALSSKEVAKLLSCSTRSVQLSTKKALNNGLKVININNETFTFNLESNKYGKSYIYETLTDKKILKLKKRRASNCKIAINELPKVNLEKPTIYDKKAVIDFYKTQKSSLKAVAQAYNIVFDNKYNVMSLERKFRRWCEAFKLQGINALEDKRGLKKASKCEHNLFLKSLVKNANIKTYFARYCFFWCEKNNKEYDIYNPTSNISYNGFKSYLNRHKNDLEVSAILKGKDFLDDIVPTFNNAKSVDYANEQWQIDSTKIDIMAKVPIIDGEIDYFSKTRSSKYALERFTLVGVVDLYSGARVYELFHTGNSYSNVRLLKKAALNMGIPEVIKGDNGKDYISEHFQNVLGHLGITYWASTPYKGAEKGKIERGFKTLQHNHIFENLAGFTGHSVAQKQIIENQVSKKSQRKGLPTNLKEEMMWWWELGVCVDSIVETLFEKEFLVHRTLYEKIHDVQINLDENFDKKLGKRFYRVINKDGISHNNTKYRSIRLWEKAKIKDKVLIIEDIYDLNKAYAVIDGEFIELISDKAFNISPQEVKEIKRAYKKRVNNSIKTIAKSGLDELSKLQKLHKIKLMKNSEFAKGTLEENEYIPSKKTTSKVPFVSSKEAKSEGLRNDDEFIDFIRSVS